MSEYALREILAQAMRRCRVGNVEPWERLTEECRAEWVASADHLLRIAGEYGLHITAEGEPASNAFPAEIEIGNNRYIRQTTDGIWKIDGTDHVFTLGDIALKADRVLSGDPSVRKIKGLGTQLAAALEIYRLDAQGGSD